MGSAARRAFARARLRCALPFPLRKAATATIAACIYWPLAMIVRASEALGLDVANVPLSACRRSSFDTMRTDALDRFGTRLEQRFSREEIRRMMESGGLGGNVFLEDVPYWVDCGRRAG